MTRTSIPLKLKLDILKLHDQIAREKDCLISFDITTYSSGEEHLEAYIDDADYDNPIHVEINKTMPAYDEPDCKHFVASEEDVKEYIKKLRKLLKIIKADNHNRLPRNRYSF